MEISTNNIRLSLSIEEVQHINDHNLLLCIEGLITNINKISSLEAIEIDYDDLMTMLQRKIYEDQDEDFYPGTEDDQYIRELYKNLIDNDSSNSE